MKGRIQNFDVPYVCTMFLALYVQWKGTSRELLVLEFDKKRSRYVDILEMGLELGSL